MLQCSQRGIVWSSHRPSNIIRKENQVRMGSASVILVSQMKQMHNSRTQFQDTCSTPKPHKPTRDWQNMFKATIMINNYYINNSTFGFWWQSYLVSSLHCTLGVLHVTCRIFWRVTISRPIQASLSLKSYLM